MFFFCVSQVSITPWDTLSVIRIEHHEAGNLESFLGLEHTFIIKPVLQDNILSSSFHLSTGQQKVRWEQLTENLTAKISIMSSRAAKNAGLQHSLKQINRGVHVKMGLIKYSCHLRTVLLHQISRDFHHGCSDNITGIEACKLMQQCLQSWQQGISYLCDGKEWKKDS